MKNFVVEEKTKGRIAVFGKVIKEGVTTYKILNNYLNHHVTDNLYGPGKKGAHEYCNILNRQSTAELYKLFKDGNGLYWVCKKSTDVDSELYIGIKGGVGYNKTTSHGIESLHDAKKKLKDAISKHDKDQKSLIFEEVD